MPECRSSSSSPNRSRFDATATITKQAEATSATLSMLRPGLHDVLRAAMANRDATPLSRERARDPRHHIENLALPQLIQVHGGHLHRIFRQQRSKKIACRDTGGDLLALETASQLCLRSRGPVLHVCRQNETMRLSRKSLNRSIREESSERAFDLIGRDSKSGG